MDTTREVVTPEIAMEWLKTNAGNRNQNRHEIDKFAHEMATGKWNEGNPQPIVFNDKGELRDGQHRLLAVIKAKTPIRFVVVRGMPDDARITLDSGRSRSDSDSLKIAGFEDAGNTESATLKMLIYNGRKVHRPSRYDLYESWKQHYRSILFAREGILPQYKKAVLLGPVARAHASGISSEKLRRFKVPFCRRDEFWARGEDEDLKPVIKLKSWIDSGRITHRQQEEFFLITTYCLRRFLDDEDVNRWPTGGISRLDREALCFPLD